MNIDYRLRRAARKTIGITVERDGSVVVTAPETLDNESIEKHVWSRRLWIWQKQAIKKHQNNEMIQKQFVSGESFYYLGRLHRLQPVDEQDKPLKLMHGWFNLRRDVQADAKKHFMKWYSERLELKIHERIAPLAKKAGIEVGKVKVLDLGYRWGSCTKEGNLNFNWKIAMAPLSIIDYVLAHELIHLKEHSHSERFWKELSKVVPDYAKRKEWLKANGVYLNL